MDLLGSLGGGGGGGEVNGMGKGASMATATLSDDSTHSTVSGAGGQTPLLIFGALVLVVLVLLFKR